MNRKAKFVVVSIMAALAIAFILAFVLIPKANRSCAFCICLSALAFAAASAIVITIIKASAARSAERSASDSVMRKVSFLRELEVGVRASISAELPENLKTALIGLADDIHFSDPMSDASLTEIEQKIGDACERLSVDTLINIDGSISKCENIRRLLRERNAMCKILKK